MVERAAVSGCVGLVTVDDTFRALNNLGQSRPVGDFMEWRGLQLGGKAPTSCSGMRSRTTSMQRRLRVADSSTSRIFFSAGCHVRNEACSHSRIPVEPIGRACRRQIRPKPPRGATWPSACRSGTRRQYRNNLEKYIIPKVGLARRGCHQTVRGRLLVLRSTPGAKDKSACEVRHASGVRIRHVVRDIPRCNTIQWISFALLTEHSATGTRQYSRRSSPADYCSTSAQSHTAQW